MLSVSNVSSNQTIGWAGGLPTSTYQYITYTLCFLYPMFQVIKQSGGPVAYPLLHISTLVIHYALGISVSSNRVGQGPTPSVYHYFSYTDILCYYILLTETLFQKYNT